MEDVTQDAILGGRVRITQPARGYRVNVDAILLAAFAAHRIGRACPPGVTPRVARCAFDLGAGVGAVGLVALALGATREVVLVEREARDAALAAKNVEDNARADVARVLHADVAVATDDHAGEADLVLCNPPYVPPGRGKPPAPARARARSGSLEVFLDAARGVLGRRGRACFVYPALEATSLLTGLRARGLEPKRVTPVHGTPAAPARVLLVEAVPGKAGGLVVTPPLVETDGRSRPSPELAALLRGG